MVKLLGCITVTFVLLGCVLGASARQPDKVIEFLSAVWMGDMDDAVTGLFRTRE